MAKRSARKSESYITMSIKWTLFWDMHSSGTTKVPPFNKIYIQAPKDIAERVFQAKFGRNPHRITCSCCGADYDVEDYATLEEASAYHRNCPWAAPNKPKDFASRSMQEQAVWNSTHQGRYLEAGEKLPRNWVMDRYNDGKHAITLKEYLTHKDVKVIYANEITEEEKKTELHEEGYVWI